MANKVNFGLKNVHYATRKTDDTGWNTPVALPGGVKLGLTKTGSTTKFYADDTEYCTFEAGGGYEGDMELALIPDAALKTLLGFVEDSKGGILEESKIVATPFVLLFEVEGDEKNRRYIFYNVTASRPPFDANTTTDSTDPDKQTLNISCTGRDITSGSGASAITKNIVKGHMERTSTNATEYDAWFTSVYVPTFVAGA